MARSTLSGMLVGPGLAKKWRPRGLVTVVFMGSTLVAVRIHQRVQGLVKPRLVLAGMRRPAVA